ncbi:MAG: TolC family protein [Planctomycetota bacterium]
MGSVRRFLMAKTRLRLACAVALFVAQGCATRPPRTQGPEPRPLGREFPVRAAPREAEGDDGSAALAEEPVGEEITLRRALALALLRSPKLSAVSWDIRIGEARRLQAGLFPNPELEVEVENFGGSGEFAGFTGSETTIVLSQLIELGGKRAARKHVAAFDAELAAWDHEAARLAVLTDTTLAFLDVLAAQEQQQLAQDAHRVAGEVLSAAAARVKAGKVSPLEEVRAGVTLSKSAIDLETARRTLEGSRGFLAATWGSWNARFKHATGDLDAVKPVPPLESIEGLVARNPDIARWAQEMEQRLAVLSLERAGRVPDLTVGAGVKYISGPDTTAFVFGFSIPIPFSDRNQGAVLEAEYELARAGDAKKVAEVRTRVALAGAYHMLASAHGAAVSLRDEVLPAARRADAAARESYKEGKLGYLDVLDAQRTLMDARQSHVDALITYHKAVAVVESLIGTGLTDIPTSENQ